MHCTVFRLCNNTVNGQITKKLWLKKNQNIKGCLPDLSSSRVESEFLGVVLSFSLEKESVIIKYYILITKLLFCNLPSTKRFGVLDAPSANKSAGLGGGVWIREPLVGLRVGAVNDGRRFARPNGLPSSVSALSFEGPNNTDNDMQTDKPATIVWQLLSQNMCVLLLSGGIG
ncbi:hypothetical protein FF38_01255 [Lucilia cuprina]|uniref:Uncharacterized protein n=1 Tax=Lucilia cuprina TaxID=7375 RepID=A0A0L0CDI1_LUCCU|nr:hypothetical protein FF38_01255 [Lucilia cuprina]